MKEIYMFVNILCWSQVIEIKIQGNNILVSSNLLVDVSCSMGLGKFGFKSQKGENFCSK